MTKRASRRRLTRTRVIGFGVATAVLLAAGAGTVFATTGSSAEYRTAVAQLGSVSETLSVSGTIASATRRDLAFPVAGTVDSVAVEVGDTVAAGGVLATVGTDDLQDAVDAAAEKVAQAEETLASDLESQTATVVEPAETTGSTSGSASTGASASTGSTSGGSSSGSSAATAAAITEVTAAQQSLLALVDAASASLAASQDATASVATVCAPFLAATLVEAAPETPATDPTASAGSNTDAAASITDAAAATSGVDALAAAQALLVACQAAMTGAGTAQSVTSAAQTAVATAMTSLDESITALQTALGGTGAGTGSGSGSGSTTGGATTTPSTSTTPSSSGSAGGSAASTASAADIVADRAAIDAAEAQVALANQQLASATLTSPIGGTVAQVTFAVGDDVTAASTTALLTVIGTDGYVIESTVSLSQVAKVEVGQTAVVTLSSSGASYDGTVSSVGILNVSDTSTPSFAVTVSVDPASDTLLNGAAATADIAVSSGYSVLTIPISALHSDTSGDTVDVLSGGVVTATPVEVGATGADSVEITSGLAAGAVVVIADLGAEIATGDTETDSGSGSGLAGLGGDTATQGGPGGGFVGGTPPGVFTPPSS